MEEEKSPSPEEITLFNNSYLLKQFEPELLDTVLASLSGDNHSLSAFKAGIEQYNYDKFDSLTLPWQNKDNMGRGDIEPDKSLDKDDIEPEID